MFLTFQTVMETCIMHAGGRNYKLSHMNNAKLEKIGRPLMSISVTEDLIAKIVELNQA